MPFGGPTSAEYPTGRPFAIALRIRERSTMSDAELGNKDGRLAATIRLRGEQFRWCGGLTQSVEQVNQHAAGLVHSRTQWFGESAAAVASHILGTQAEAPPTKKPPREGLGERAGLASTGRSTLQRERRWTTAVGARLAYLRPGRLHMRAEPE